MRTPEEQAVAVAAIALMRGVVYRETSADAWEHLARYGAAVREHFETVGVEVVLDEDEGYAYLRSREDVDGEDPLPRLVQRRTLTYHVSLLLVLLRKRLVEHESTSAEGRLVLGRAQITDMLRVFAADTSDEARVVDQVDRTLAKAAELGFVRQLKSQTGGARGPSGSTQDQQWEVRRILKAYVDAQTLADYAGKLDEYAARHRPSAGTAGLTRETTG